VLTGGTVAIEGITELAEQIFDAPVRIGYPMGISGLVDVVNSPLFATGVGLVKWGVLNRGAEHASAARNNGMLEDVMGKVRRWFSEAF
jgi:cell division protein FtsA